MARIGSLTAIAGAIAAALTLGVAGGASAQEGGTPASPAWGVLVRCAEMTNDEAQLACYNAAMRTAGYAPKPETVAAATTERHKRFGLSLPTLGVIKKHSREEGARAAESAAPQPAAAPPSAAVAQEDESHVVVKLDQVLKTPPLGRLLFITTEGALWSQTDEEVVSPTPKAGQMMTIRRGSMSGYFCAFDKRNAVRCERVR